MPRCDVRLAINLFDMDRLPDSVREAMFRDESGRPLLEPSTVRVGDRDEVCVPFCCDTLTAAIRLDVIRSGDRSGGDQPTRAYVMRATAWQKLPADALLTVVGGEVVELNPTTFGTQAAPTARKAVRV